MTPRKEDDPLVKPGLVRLIAMTSSAMGTVSRRSKSAVYLQLKAHAQHTRARFLAESPKLEVELRV